MSFVVQAPLPLVQTTLLLPSPLVGNQKNLASTVETIRSMNGRVYTYIKSKRGRMVYQWDFRTTKDKAREAREFIRIYNGKVVRVTDHNDSKIEGYITVNPLEFRGDGRAGGYPSGEVYTWTLSIEENV